MGRRRQRGSKWHATHGMEKGERARRPPPSLFNKTHTTTIYLVSRVYPRTAVREDCHVLRLCPNCWGMKAGSCRWTRADALRRRRSRAGASHRHEDEPRPARNRLAQSVASWSYCFTSAARICAAPGVSVLGTETVPLRGMALSAAAMPSASPCALQQPACSVRAGAWCNACLL